jgi:ribosomal protein L11 methyltransferase
MIRLAIRAPTEHAELVLAELLELAPAGFEQVEGDGFVEFALYGAPGELPTLPTGPADIAGFRVEVSGSEVGDDWATRWREFHRPVQVGHLHVRPPWTDPPGEGIDIVIDPAQAFGTGAHPTTRLSLGLLLVVAAARETSMPPLVDLGCGSGVLAIAAAKLGFSPVTALDHDPAAVDATLDNARANGVTLERVERYDLREQPAPVAPVVTANLMRPLLLRVAELLPEQPEMLIISGLLEGEEEVVATAFEPLRERRRLRLQGWSALLLTRP